MPRRLVAYRSRSRYQPGNVPAASPVLLTVIVQLKELPNATLLLTLLVFVTIRSASERYTVTLSGFDVDSADRSSGGIRHQGCCKICKRDHIGRGTR